MNPAFYELFIAPVAVLEVFVPDRAGSGESFSPSSPPRSTDVAVEAVAAEIGNFPNNTSPELPFSLVSETLGREAGRISSLIPIPPSNDCGMFVPVAVPTLFTLLLSDSWVWVPVCDE